MIARRCSATLLAAAAAVCASPSGAGARAHAHLNGSQRSTLHVMAADTWRFYASDIDSVTHLPLDNIGPGSTRGQYTSAANIGVYLWSVVAAKDLRLVSARRAVSLARATLREVASLKRSDGLLYQWYDTTNGHVMLDPAKGDCTDTAPKQDNCSFLSAVDNGWYASGLIEVRRALPELRGITSRPGLLLAGAVAGPGSLAIDPRPGVGADIQRLGGRLRVSGQLAVLRPDVRRGHVRGPDGEPRRA